MKKNAFVIILIIAASLLMWPSLTRAYTPCPNGISFMATASGYEQVSCAGLGGNPTPSPTPTTAPSVQPFPTEIAYYQGILAMTGTTAGQNPSPDPSSSAWVYNNTKNNSPSTGNVIMGKVQIEVNVNSTQGVSYPLYYGVSLYDKPVKVHCTGYCFPNLQNQYIYVPTNSRAEPVGDGHFAVFDWLCTFGWYTCATNGPAEVDLYGAHGMNGVASGGTANVGNGGYCFPTGNNTTNTTQGAICNGTAAGIPEFLGSFAFDELLSGPLNHAVDMGVYCGQNGVGVHPASTLDGSCTSAQGPPGGAILCDTYLDSDINAQSIPVWAKNWWITLDCQHYGAVVTDTGTASVGTINQNRSDQVDFALGVAGRNITFYNNYVSGTGCGAVTGPSGCNAYTLDSNNTVAWTIPYGTLTGIGDGTRWEYLPAIARNP